MAKGARGREGRGRGRKAGRLNNNNNEQRRVSEETRIDIKQALDEFKASKDAELTFSSELSNHDRATLHNECKKYGLSSKSRGKGLNRALTVFKPSGTLPRFLDKPFDLNPGPSSMQAMRNHFLNYPPSQVELANAAKGTIPATQRPAEPKRRGRDRNSGRRNAGAASAISQEEALRRYEAGESNCPSSLLKQRKGLPAFRMRDKIMETIGSNRVTVVAGETGSGKTTQVPQFILDDALSRGEGAYIACTQPRKISAVTVAERVAAERGEEVGNTSGYQIRLESRMDDVKTHMAFCTNGVLLRKLTGADSAAGGEASEVDRMTHIVVDEVHERDQYADFLLIILRRLLSRKPDLKVVLMSATMNEALFSEYFGGAPIVRIPGRAHSVDVWHLENTLPLLFDNQGARTDGALAPPDGNAQRKGNAKVAKSSSSAPPAWKKEEAEGAIEGAFLGEAEVADLLSVDVSAVNVQHSQTGATALMVAAGKGSLDVCYSLLQRGADITLRSNDNSTVIDWALLFGHTSVAEKLEPKLKRACNAPAAGGAEGSITGASAGGDAKHPPREATAEDLELVAEYQRGADPDEVDVDLVAAVVEMMHERYAPNVKSQMGSILVFVPGWEEIQKITDSLAESEHRNTLQVLPLHSMVSSHEQKRVFNRPPTGVRKVILATNIAETSVTIDDVVTVIDTGRVKEKSFDAYSSVATLQSAWVSQANAKQRKGRAGRCQPGICVRLYTNARFDSMEPEQLPEIKRSPLEELCLQVKLLECGLCGGADGKTASENPPKSGGGGEIASFLSEAIEPPVDKAVENAVDLLNSIGALTREGEELTDLGRELAEMPIHPRLGRMVLLSSMLGLLEPILSVAATCAHRLPFAIAANAEEKKISKRARLDLCARYGGESDHLAAVAALSDWEAIRGEGGGRKGRGKGNANRGTGKVGRPVQKYMKQNNGWKRYLEDYKVSMGALNMISGIKAQVGRSVRERRKGERARGSSNKGFGLDRNEDDVGLLRAAIASGLYPMVAVAQPKRKGKGQVKLTMSTGEEVAVQASSLISKMNMKKNAGKEEEKGGRRNGEAQLVAFDEVTRNETQLQIASGTAVEPMALLMSANELTVHDDYDRGDSDVEEDNDDDEGEGANKEGTSMPTHAIVRLDGWIDFRLPVSAVSQICLLRLRMHEAFEHFIKRPNEAYSQQMKDAIGSAASALSFEANARIPAPLEYEEGSKEPGPSTHSGLAGREGGRVGNRGRPRPPSPSGRGRSRGGGRHAPNGRGRSRGRSHD